MDQTCQKRNAVSFFIINPPKVSEYDQEIPQIHTADQPAAPWGRAAEYL